ncbi:TerB family tellurite resistance protein [Streptomyces synnematoformans]|uniref:TerB family tellurite resistance protein n=1 Tax=Streptomyces synnematoformans TaxID=415721 RepID=UPI000482A67C
MEVDVTHFLRRFAGVRTSWHTESDGEFFCPGCGGDRNYRRLSGRRWFTVLGLPVLPRGDAGPVVECADCGGHFAPAALAEPTSTRFALLLRDATHAVALAVLHAGGTSSPAVRGAAVAAVRTAGYGDCTEEQLLTLLAAIEADSGRMPDLCAESPAERRNFEAELHETLAPLTPHLVPAGRESILLGGARIALADGAYTPPEWETLVVVGDALQLPGADVERLLTSARTPS